MAHLTNLKQNNIDKIILNYNILNFINFIPIYDGIQNSNYIINTKNHKFILTIFEDKYVVNNIPATAPIKAPTIPIIAPIITNNMIISLSVIPKALRIPISLTLEFTIIIKIVITPKLEATIPAYDIV